MFVTECATIYFSLADLSFCGVYRLMIKPRITEFQAEFIHIFTSSRQAVGSTIELA